MHMYIGLITCMCPCITSGQIAEIVSEGRTCKTNNLCMWYYKFNQLNMIYVLIIV